MVWMMSLRTRLALLLALTVLVVLGTAAKVVDWRADAEMQQRFDASLLARAQALASLVRVEDGVVRLDAVDDSASVFPDNLRDSWYILQCDGAVVARTSVVPPALVPDAGKPRFSDAQLPQGPLLRVVALGFRAAPDPEGDAGKASFAKTFYCALRFARDRGQLEDLLRNLDFILLGSLLSACALVILLTPWLVRRGLRPLAELAHAMAGVGPEVPGARLPASRTTELVPLISRFNEVLARMDDGFARERQFASGLAHEFRTRLAELRTLVDVEKRYPSGRDARSLLDEVGSISGELEATVTALLQLTRIQSGLEASHVEDMPLIPLLERVCMRYAAAAHARSVCIESASNCDTALTIEADPALLEIVLDNLLGNAVAYTPPGTRVDIRATHADLTVSNAAPALHPDDLANFGQRFWRKDSRGAGHAGLGLALAGTAARALKMSLTFALDEGVLHATLRWGAPSTDKS